MEEKSASLAAFKTHAAQELPRLIERMHRRYLDLVRIELTKQNFLDISPVQAVMLGTIGGPNGNDEISVRDLIERGYYLGSNASYNLKDLIDGKYIDRQASLRDRRLARIKLSDRGREILGILTKINATMAEEFDACALETTFQTLRQFERRWTEAIHAENAV